MGRVASTALKARVQHRDARLAKARQRRLELDNDRASRDARIDQAVADVYLAQDDRAAAAAAIAQAEAKMAEALTRILTERVCLAHAAKLTGMSVHQSQRLKALVIKPSDAGTEPVVGRKTSHRTRAQLVPAEPGVAVPSTGSTEPVAELPDHH